MKTLDAAPTIKTERLTLRPWKLGDLEDVLQYATDPEFRRYLPRVPKNYSRKDGAEYVAHMVLADAATDLELAIEFGGYVVGAISLRQDAQNDVVTLGYGIGRSHWGKGIMTEAASAATKLAFETLGAEKVRATADAENVASWRVMEKLGMQREGYFRSHRIHDGERRDEVEYGILRAEWLAR